MWQSPRDWYQKMHDFKGASKSILSSEFLFLSAYDLSNPLILSRQAWSMCTSVHDCGRIVHYYLTLEKKNYLDYTEYTLIKLKTLSFWFFRRKNMSSWMLNRALATTWLFPIYMMTIRCFKAEIRLNVIFSNSLLFLDNLYLVILGYLFRAVIMGCIILILTKPCCIKCF